MGSNWIDLKFSSQYMLTSLQPITKQSPTEGLVQAKYAPIVFFVFAVAVYVSNMQLVYLKLSPETLRIRCLGNSLMLTPNRCFKILMLCICTSVLI